MPALPDAFDTCQTPVVVRHPSFRDSEQGKLKEALAGLFNNVRGLPWVPQARAVVATSPLRRDPRRSDRRGASAMSRWPSISAASPGHSISGSDRGLPPWYRFATNGLLLCCTSPMVASAIPTRECRFQGFFVDFNRQYVHQVITVRRGIFFGPVADQGISDAKRKLLQTICCWLSPAAARLSHAAAEDLPRTFHPSADPSC